MFSGYLRTFHGHFEPRRAQRLLHQQQHRLRGINNRRKHRTNYRTTFSMSGLVGRTEIATADIADTSETVRPCVRKHGGHRNFPSIWNLTCSKRVRSQNFLCWQAARPRPVRLASAPVRTKWSNDNDVVEFFSLRGGPASVRANDMTPIAQRSGAGLLFLAAFLGRLRMMLLVSQSHSDVGTQDAGSTRPHGARSVMCSKRRVLIHDVKTAPFLCPPYFTVQNMWLESGKQDGGGGDIAPRK